MLFLEESINANAAQLQAGHAVISGIPNDLYTKTERSILQNSIGPHVRHIVEFYHCFCLGMERRFVDYSQRPRDVRTEVDVDYASARLCEIIDWLLSVSDMDDTNLDVRHEPATAYSKVNTSSRGREFEFLLSHTAHHFAMIAVILRANNISVSDDFGLAESTRLHRIVSEKGATG